MLLRSPPLTFAYNGLDDRVSQSQPVGPATDTRRYVYDSQGRMLGEYGASVSAIRAEYIYLTPDAANDNPSPFGGDDGMAGYGLLAILAPDPATQQVVPTFVHSNHLGVPTLLMNANGNVAQAGDYAMPVFPGQTRTLTDLYYNRYRDYDPTIGRYIQTDPIGLAGGANPYLYANGNPVRYIDPTGEFVPLIVIGAIGWGIFDAAIDYGIQKFIEGKDEDCIDWTSVWISGGVGALTGGIGGVGRIAKRGFEFSHWIPARYINPISKSYKSWLDNKYMRRFIDSDHNGNYVPDWFHNKSDFWRRLAGSHVADKWSKPIQQIVRFPTWAWAPIGAVGIGVVEAGENE